MSYVPKLNDYVIWNGYCNTLEGWVYFVGDQYITIEIKVTPKHPEDLPNGTHHRNERTCVVCYREQWNELVYVKSRKCVYDGA